MVDYRGPIDLPRPPRRKTQKALPIAPRGHTMLRSIQIPNKDPQA